MTSTVHINPLNAGIKKTSQAVNSANYAHALNEICDTCPPMATSCEDSVSRVLTTPEKLENIVGATVDGVYIPFSSPVLSTNGDGVRAAVANLFLKTENYVLVNGTYVTGTSTLTLSHVGQSILNSIRLSGGTSIAMTRKCTYKSVCTSKMSVVGTLNSIVLNGVTTPLTAAAWSGTPATNVATALTLKNELAAAVGVAYTVTVTPNSTTSQFDIKVDGSGYLNATINGNIFENCGCVGAWAA